MTSLRTYMMNTLCTIQVYNYLPKNKHVSGISAYVSHSGYYKLHLAISPPILQQFSWSQWLQKAFEKTFQSIPVTPRSNQYWPRY